MSASEKVLTIPAQARPRWAEGVQEYPVGEELLLYAPRQTGVHTLNTSRREIWERCDGCHTVEEISGMLATPLGLTCDDMRPDVLRAVGELAGLGLLEVL